MWCGIKSCSLSDEGFASESKRGEVALGVRNVQLSVCVASFVAVLRYRPTDGIGEVVDVAELSAERRGVFFDR